MKSDQTYRFRSDVPWDRKLQKEYYNGCRHANPILLILDLALIAIVLWFSYEMILVLGAVDRYAIVIPFIVLVWSLYEGIPIFTGSRRRRPGYDSVAFYDDEILTSDAENAPVSTIPYSSIRAVYETKTLFLCALKRNAFLMVDKGSFTGSREDFLAFLLPRCTSMRQKKAKSCKPGQILDCIKWTVVLIPLLLSVMVHPWIQIPQRIQGLLHNGIPAQQMLEELESYGISGVDPSQTKALDNPLVYLPNSKLENMLLTMSTGSHNDETGVWIPAETGVFYTDYWGNDSKTMYTTLLRGISAMSRGTVVIKNIVEDHSGVDWEAGTGRISVDFLLNGSPKTLETNFSKGSYGVDAFQLLGDMVFDASGKHLYMADLDFSGCFFFLGDEQWAQAFSTRTGMRLVTNLYDLYS